MKKCCLCGKAGDFARSKYSKDGLRSECKTCGNERQKKARREIAARSLPPVDEFEITVEEATPLETAYREHTTAREKRDLKREHSALVEENQQLRQELTAVRSMNSRAPEILVYKQAAWERADAVACALASDWHVEEPVDSAEVHKLNEFNLDVARSRSEHFFRNFLRLADMMARDSKVNTIYLAALGDFFSGWIHEELVANSLLAPADAAHFCKGLFFSGIDFLLRESSYVIEGDMLAGNHGRMTRQMHFGDPTGTSLETFMYHSIADRYHDNPRVHLRVASQAMVYRRFFERFNMRLIHGYEVKYGGGVGGLTIPLRKALAQWNNPIRADLTALGHFHTRFDGGDFLVNGSLIGYNTFAQAIKASFEEAQQTFFLIHARGGGEKSLTGPIWLDDAHKAVAA